MAEYRDESDVRTEQPTPLRLEEARRQGRVARSGELTSAVMVLGAFVALGLLGPRLLAALVQMTAALLDGSSAPLAGPGASGMALWQSLTGVLSATAGLLLAAVALAVAANVLQVGFLAAGEPLQPNLARLSPAANLRRIFSRRSGVRLGLTIVKLVLAAGVTWAVMRSYWPRMVAAAAAPTTQLAGLAGQMAQQLALRVGLVLLGAGAVDTLYQRWQHHEDLKMTRREWAEDMRRMEGDRRILARRRQAAREAASGRATRPAAAAQRKGSHGDPA